MGKPTDKTIFKCIKCHKYFKVINYVYIECAPPKRLIDAVTSICDKCKGEKVEKRANTN